MSTYYCYKHARKHITPVDLANLAWDSMTGYRLEKFIKHTAPTGIYNVNSVFNTTDWQDIRDYEIVAAASGCLEIDDQGRKNLLYFAGKPTGMTFRNGQFSSICSGVVLVCSESTGYIHSFAKDFTAEFQTCADCGAFVPFDPRTFIG